MQKIMFNDRYGLTDAVIDYIKNNTRRIEGGRQFQLAATAAKISLTRKLLDVS